MKRSSYWIPSRSLKKERVPFCEPKNLGSLRAPAPQREGAIDEREVVEQDHASGSGGRDDVGQGEARERDVRASPGGRSAQRRAEAIAGVLDDTKSTAIRDRAQNVPVRAVADQVRDQHRLRARSDRRLDPIEVDLIGVRRDVEQHGDEPSADDRSNVGREGQRRRQDLVAGLEREQLDGEVERRRARVHHHAARLAERIRDESLHLPSLRPDPERRGSTTQDGDDGLDLLLVVNAARILDPPQCHPEILPRAVWQGPPRPNRSGSISRAPRRGSSRRPFDPVMPSPGSPALPAQRGPPRSSA